MTNLKIHLFSAVAVLALASPAAAHRGWLLPSATVFSGAHDWVTVDAAISNDLFFPDHVAMGTDGIKVWAPDGSPGTIANASKGAVRSTFDVQLDKPGTWKIGTEMSNVSGSFKVNGEDWSVGRRRGPPPPAAGAAAGAPGARVPGQPSPAQLNPAQPGPAQAAPGQPGAGQPGPGGAQPSRNVVASVADIPANATDVKLTESFSSNVIYVTAGAPTTTVFKPANKGLELAPVTHPDELVANEPAKFRFLVDGKPAANVKVTVIPGGKRYRDGDGAQELTTGTDGVLTVKWDTPGMYWLSATITDDHPATPRATQRRMTFVTTLEVMAP